VDLCALQLVSLGAYTVSVHDLLAHTVSVADSIQHNSFDDVVTALHAA
jgi:hypothetical protein